jgi:hypothetical protein
MSAKATPTDAELILKLYDIRREPEMRRARNFWLGFWPESVEDFMKIGMALGTQENAWMRQVGGYWEMAASLVLHGTLNKEMFLEQSFSGEMFVLYAKVEPFLKDLREKMQSPAIFANVEKVIMSSADGMERVKSTQQRMAMFRKAAQTAKAS